jgi:hypothetical protein
MEIHFTIPKKFNPIFESLKELTSEFTLRIKDGKLIISEMDGSHVCLFYVSFPYNALISTNINETTKFNMIINSKDFWKLLNTKGSEPTRIFLYDKKNFHDGKVSTYYNIRATKDGQEEQFLSGSTDQSIISEQVTESVMNYLTTKLQIGSNLLSKTLKYIETYDLFVEININSIAEFSDTPRNIRIIHKYVDKDSDDFINKISKIEEKEPIKAIYPIGYLLNFLKVSKLVPRLNAELGTEMPLRLTYSAEQEFDLKFVIAPKVPED